jgi:hypothetical protein
MAVYTDNFDSYAVGPLGGKGNWVSCVDRLSLYDNAGDKRLRYYHNGVVEVVNRSETFLDNQYSQVAIETPNVYSPIGPCVRTQGTGETTMGYGLTAYSDGEVGILYFNAGVKTILETVYIDAVNDGDILKITAIGNVITGYINGAQVISVEDNGILTGGTPGIYANYLYWNVYAYVDDWEGGDIGVDGSISGMISDNSTLSAVLVAKGILTGTISTVTSNSVVLIAKGTLQSISETNTSLTAILIGNGALVGGVEGHSEILGVFYLEGLRGQIQINTILLGELSGVGELLGVISTFTGILGSINIPIVITEIIDKDSYICVLLDFASIVNNQIDGDSKIECILTHNSSIL